MLCAFSTNLRSFRWAVELKAAIVEELKGIRKAIEALQRTQETLLASSRNQASVGFLIMGGPELEAPETDTGCYLDTGKI